MLDNNEPNFSSVCVKTSLNWHTLTLEENWIVYSLSVQQRIRDISRSFLLEWEIIFFVESRKLSNVAQFFCGIWITYLSSADIRHYTIVLFSSIK